MIKRRDMVLIIFSILLVFSIIILIIQGTSNVRDVRFATSGNTISNVSIQKFFSIAFSPDLADGIQFGTVSNIPTFDQNATKNFAGGGPALNFSNYNITVSIDSNVPVDFCTLGTGDMVSPSFDTIGLDNLTMINTTDVLSTLTNPLPSLSVSLTTLLVKNAANIPPGGATLYKFWLDVQAGTPSGVYENVIVFSGVEATTACV